MNCVSSQKRAQILTALVEGNSIRSTCRMTGADIWTWVALDPETKLVLSWLVGPQSAEAGEIIAQDLASRLANRVQISTDGYNMYPSAIERPSAGTGLTTPC
jgi:IS1 family transposase